MRYRQLGSTGLPVSAACLGTMTFGGQCDEPTSRAILDRACELGVTFIDTADVYPLGGDLSTVGVTEEIIGRWLAGRRRDDVILATKGFGATVLAVDIDLPVDIVAALDEVTSQIPPAPTRGAA